MFDRVEVTSRLSVIIYFSTWLKNCCSFFILASINFHTNKDCDWKVDGPAQEIERDSESAYLDFTKRYFRMNFAFFEAIIININ